MNEDFEKTLRARVDDMLAGWLMGKGASVEDPVETDLPALEDLMWAIHARLYPTPPLDWEEDQAVEVLLHEMVVMGLQNRGDVKMLPWLEAA